jgi:RNA polymerase sigma-70 factor, ECF subfamily
MAPDLVALTFGQLLAFFAVFIIRNRGFAPHRLSGAELAAHLAPIRRIIARKLQRAGLAEDEADDLTQDVMLAAWEASEENRYRPDPSVPPKEALRRWLRKVAYHHLGHHFEAMKVRQAVMSPARPRGRSTATLADEALISQDDRLDLLRALQELEPDLQDIVVAHDLDGLPMKEIAAAHGLPLSTAYKRRVRALRALAALRPAEE